jgi:hypothetical protein
VPSTKCEVELHSTGDQMFVELTCSLRIESKMNSTELSFNVPEPLNKYAKIVRASNNSQTLTLTMNSTHILLNAVSCRLNRHRDDVCFFNIRLISRPIEMSESLRKNPESAANKHDPLRNVHNLMWAYLFFGCVGFVLYVYAHFIFQFK